MEILPKYDSTNLTRRVRIAAQEMVIGLPDESLALLYWDHDGTCRAFVLTEDNMHFAVANLQGVYAHRSEIIPL